MKTNNGLDRKSDITGRRSSLKWNWAGRVVRQNEHRRREIASLRGERREIGRPLLRWYDDLKRTDGLNWYQVTPDRTRWKNIEKKRLKT